jgi:Zn-dependent M28 family amino/carboxypeptidase
MRPMFLVLALLLQAPAPVIDEITAESVYAHVAELASDAYQGREAGTPGADKAADYIAKKLSDWKLAPAGVRGMFFQPFDANGKATKNVLAFIQGSHTTLKNEFVLIGAHYDHIGVGGRGEDTINNGADDNASGTAAVLEIARAMASQKERPARSVLFAFWSGEEKGLLGSKYFVDHPTVNLRNVIACLNLDMVGRNAEDAIDIEGTGCSNDLKACFERVNLKKIFAKISYQVKEVKQDTDHYWFYATGIPAVEFFSGYHADYHKPGDESEKVVKKKLERVGRFVAHAAWDLAGAKPRPGFKKVGK